MQPSEGWCVATCNVHTYTGVAEQEGWGGVVGAGEEDRLQLQERALPLVEMGRVRKYSNTGYGVTVTAVS